MAKITKSTNSIGRGGGRAGAGRPKTLTEENKSYQLYAPVSLIEKAITKNGGKKLQEEGRKWLKKMAE